jgi:hypothetical protein
MVAILLLVIQLFRSLRYHGFVPSGKRSNARHERRNHAALYGVQPTYVSRAAEAVRRAVLDYLTLEERKGCPAGSPYEETRGLFNLSSQLIGVLVKAFIDQIDVSMLGPMGRDPGRSPAMARAIVGYISKQMHSAFVRDFSGEMDMLSDVVSGLMSGGYVSQLVEHRLRSSMQ